MKFIHSADLQLGARFSQFGPKAELLRKARLQTLETALRMANELAVDAFLIAGDLFEDRQVDDAVITAALAKFGSLSDLPIFILPGNHDPNTGPGSIWNRKPFTGKPPNVTILAEPGVYDCAGARLIASPLKQKVSTIDPSLKIAELARELPDDRIQIGITHGALAIPAQHQPNDFPIALEAATRAGLDYLAVGHWHTWQMYDHGRLVMPGTAEPDGFEQAGAGSIALVEIAARGATPNVQQIPVATLRWQMLECDYTDLQTARQSLEHKLAELRPLADRTVLRVKLGGSVSPRALSEARQWLESAVEPFLVSQILDQTSVAFSAAELEELQRNHPLLAQTIADLTQIEHLATNAPLPAGIDQSQVIPLSQAQALLSNAKIEMSMLDGDFFKFAHQLLSQKLQEAIR
jgi:DNA repair exonuclease SbcCD nuclease subunit